MERSSDMGTVDYKDVEVLLRPELRGGLSPWALLRLYLDPFVLFKNVNCGTLFNQRAALNYNKALRWVLVLYLRRWFCIASACLLALNPAASMAATNPVFLVPAVGLGLTFTVGFVAVIVIGAAYLMLGRV